MMSTTSLLSTPRPSLLLSMTHHSPSFLFTPHPTSSSRDTTTTMMTTTWRTWQHGHHVIVNPLPITTPLIDDLPFTIPLIHPTPYLIQSRHNWQNTTSRSRTGMTSQTLQFRNHRNHRNCPEPSGSDQNWLELQEVSEPTVPNSAVPL